MNALSQVRERVRRFEKEAHAILSAHEKARSRVVILDATYATLSGLSLRQDELIRQALRCAEAELFRASHVMAWAGFMDFLEDKLASDGLVRLAAARPKWPTKSLEELRENVNEYQLVEAARDLGLCSKNETKALHGMLNKRNECAHPSDYFPDLNETLGYISEVLRRIRTLMPKAL
jgi:hypothetical protein